MHTFEHDGVVFNYNADMSGDVIIWREGQKPRMNLLVPASALVAFVADYVRRERISAIEDASDIEMLGLNAPSGSNSPSGYRAG